MSQNVFGEDIALCCSSPVTGFYRDGFCRTGPDDVGMHTVCTQVTEEFLEYTKNKGNDLSTPNPMFGFPGLKPGDRWCVCVQRWREALDDGCAPPVVLEATHVSALEHVTMDDLKRHAVK